MKQIDIMVYDFDGTLCNTLPDIVNSMNVVLVNYGFGAIPYEKVRSFIGSGISTLVQRSVYCALAGDNNESVSKELLNKIGLKMSEYYTNHLMDNSFLYPDTIQVLEHFKDFPQVIVSNKPEAMVKSMLNDFQISHYFDLVVGGDTLDVCKPAPEVWEYVKTKMSLADVYTGFMVGDSVPDLVFAKVSGLKGVAVTYGYNDLPVLEKEGADYFIDKLSKLINLV